MIHGLPFENVPDAEPFFISQRWTIPRKPRHGNVRGRSAASRKSVDPPPGDKWAHIEPTTEIKMSCAMKVQLVSECEAATAVFSKAVAEMRRKIGTSTKEE
jgi:hypothetical protein